MTSAVARGAHDAAAVGRSVAVRMPGARPLVGHIPAYRRDPEALLALAGRTPGDVLELRLRTRAYIVRSLDDIRHVLVDGHDAFAERSRFRGATGRRVLGPTLFVASGDEAPDRKAIVRPALVEHSVAGFDADIAWAAELACGSWREAQERDVMPDLARLARLVALRVVLGAGAATAQLEADLVASRRPFQRATRARIAAPGWMPRALRPSERGAARRLNAHVDGAIAERRGSGARESDLLSAMMLRPGGRDLPATTMREEAMVLAGTAMSTLTRALSFLVGELARAADARAAVAAEVDAVLHGEQACAQDLARLTVLDRSYAEALRLDPPVWHMMRRASAATTLPSGVAIGVGAKVIVSPWLLHRDAELWPEPTRFDPDRFLPAAIKARPKLAYLPFGSGPRICPGRALAGLATKLALAWIVQRWDFEQAPAAELRPVLRPDGLFPAGAVRIVPRRR